MKLKNGKYNIEITEIGFEDVDDKTFIFDPEVIEIEVTLVFKITITYKDKTKKEKVQRKKPKWVDHFGFLLLPFNFN